MNLTEVIVCICLSLIVAISLMGATYLPQGCYTTHTELGICWEPPDDWEAGYEKDLFIAIDRFGTLCGTWNYNLGNVIKLYVKEKRLVKRLKSVCGKKCRSVK